MFLLSVHVCVCALTRLLIIYLIRLYFITHSNYQIFIIKKESVKMAVFIKINVFWFKEIAAVYIHTCIYLK